MSSIRTEEATWLYESAFQSALRMPTDPSIPVIPSFFMRPDRWAQGAGDMVMGMGMGMHVDMGRPGGRAGAGTCLRESPWPVGLSRDPWPRGP